MVFSSSLAFSKEYIYIYIYIKNKNERKLEGGVSSSLEFLPNSSSKTLKDINSMTIIGGQFEMPTMISFLRVKELYP